MSKPKHTPGPWHFIAPNGDNMVRIHSPYKTTNEQGVPICTLIADSRESVDSLANARLIAAAPDAVTLMQDLQEYLCEHGGVAVELLERVDAWVAKATGGDHE